MPLELTAPNLLLAIEKMVPVETMDWHESEGIGYKWTRAHKGMVLAQHSHPYTHTLFLACGQVRFFVKDNMGAIYNAPAFIEVPAHHKHYAEIMEDGTTMLCIHNTDRHPGHEIEAENSVRELT